MFIEEQVANKLSSGITDWLHPSPLGHLGIHPQTWGVRCTEYVASQRDPDWSCTDAPAGGSHPGPY